MNRVRIGVIGLGAIAQVMHLPYLVDDDDRFEIVAISDVSPDTLAAVGDRYGVAARHTDWRALLARDDVDAVGVFHSGSHRDTVMAALDSGKHVFVEKPLAYNAREAREVAERARRSDRVVQLGYHKLYDPGFAYAKEQIAQMRDLGFVRITVLHPDNQLGLSPFRIRRGNGLVEEGHVEPGPWAAQVAGNRRAVAEGPAAALIDEALGPRKDDASLRVAYHILVVSVIHQVYTLYGFLGAPERVLETTVWRDGLSIHAVLAYPNDLRVTLDWHLLTHLKDYREEYAFFGNHDRVLFQLPAPYFRHFPSPVVVQGGDGELAWEKRVTVSYEEAFQRELRAFHASVTQGAPVLTGPEDAVAHMALIEEMARMVRRP